MKTANRTYFHVACFATRPSEVAPSGGLFIIRSAAYKVHGGADILLFGCLLVPLHRFVNSAVNKRIDAAAVFY